MKERENKDTASAAAAMPSFLAHNEHKALHLKEIGKDLIRERKSKKKLGTDNTIVVLTQFLTTLSLQFI